VRRTNKDTHPETHRALALRFPYAARPAEKRPRHGLA
jgi:hypothetical protein